MQSKEMPASLASVAQSPAHRPRSWRNQSNPLAPEHIPNVRSVVDSSHHHHHPRRRLLLLRLLRLRRLHRLLRLHRLRRHRRHHHQCQHSIPYILSKGLKACHQSSLLLRQDARYLWATFKLRPGAHIHQALQQSCGVWVGWSSERDRSVRFFVFVFVFKDGARGGRRRGGEGWWVRFPAHLDPGEGEGGGGGREGGVVPGRALTLTRLVCIFRVSGSIRGLAGRQAGRWEGASLAWAPEVVGAMGVFPAHREEGGSVER